MDLLEIRRKAKEKKEAEAKAAIEAGKPSPPGEKVSEAAEEPAPAGGVLKKKKRGKRRKAAPDVPANIPEKAAPEVMEEPPVPDMPTGDRAVAEEAGEPEDIWLEEAPRAEPEAGEPEPPARPAAPAPPSGPETAAVMDEWTGANGDAEEEEDRVIEYLAFMLSDEEYAVKVEDVKEIIRLQRITKVPRAEEFVEGIISLRGVIIPVYDIKKRLGLEMTERQRSVRIVIISGDGSLQGIIVDKVTGVARLGESAIEPPPAVIGGVEGEYLEGVGRIGDRLLILFNTERALSLDSGVER